MYEVERTFLFDTSFLRKLPKFGKLASEKRLVDKYYDTEDFVWLSKGFWLRERSGEWELKLYSSDGAGTSMSREITDEAEILELMELPRIGLKRAVAESSLQVFCSLDSVRKKYLVSGLSVDIDETRGDGFSYKVGEVEALVSSPTDMEHAKQEVLDFMRTHNLSEAPVRGKVIEYLWRRMPDVYKTLVAQGAIKGFELDGSTAAMSE